MHIEIVHNKNEITDYDGRINTTHNVNLPHIYIKDTRIHTHAHTFPYFFRMWVQFVVLFDQIDSLPRKS